MKFLDALEKARETRPLAPENNKSLRTAIQKLRRKEFIKIGKLRFSRLLHAETAIVNLLLHNGHAADVKAATDRYGAIDWMQLFELLLKYLPQILALILSIV